MGMMMERLKHEGTSYIFSDLLKIFVKMRVSWSAPDLCNSLGLVLFSFSASGRPGAPRLR